MFGFHNLSGPNSSRITSRGSDVDGLSLDRAGTPSTSNSSRRREWIAHS
jgi:hypothetical protein